MATVPLKPAALAKMAVIIIYYIEFKAAVYMDAYYTATFFTELYWCKT